MTGVAGGMLPVPYDMGGMPMRDAALSQSIPVGALATALANATPDQQRTVCPITILFAYSFLI
jgi:polyadenylate-binding protein